MVLLLRPLLAANLVSWLIHAANGSFEARMQELQPGHRMRRLQDQDTETISSKGAEDNTSEVTASTAPSVQEAAATKGVQSTRTTSTAASEKRVEELTDKVATLNAELLSLRQKLTDETQKTSQLQESLVSKDEALAKLQNGKTEKEKEVASLTSQLDEVTKAKEKEVTSLTSQLDEMTKAKAASAQQIQELTSKSKLQEEEGSRLATEVSNLQAKVSGLTQDLKNSDKLRKDLEVEHYELEQKYADPAVQHFLERKAIKMYHHPGIEGAANKSYTYVLPSLRKRYSQGEEFINASKAVVFNKLNAYVGSENVEPWLPLMSGLLVYGSLVIPFACAVCCLTRIICRLRVCLLFCHLYYMLVCAFAAGYAFVAGSDPLVAFAMHDASVYLFAQIFLATSLVLYVLAQILSYCCSRSGTESFYRLIQISGSCAMVFAYYIGVWTPAMLDQLPKLDKHAASIVGTAAWTTLAFVPYVIPLLVFCALLGLEVLISLSRNPVERKAEQASVGMRDVEELASLIGKDIELGEKKS